MEAIPTDLLLEELNMIVVIVEVLFDYHFDLILSIKNHKNYFWEW